MHRLFICLAFLFTFSLVQAQDATPETEAGWIVEQRCVSEPTMPPEGWSFEGTILMTGYAGIHAVRDEWETPHVVASVGEPRGGSLSPNGHWYAAPWGDVVTEPTYNTVTTVREIRVFSTTDDDEEYRIPWSEVFFSQGSWGQVFWHDNEHLVFMLNNEVILVNPFTGETERLPALAVWGGGDYGQPHPSPDWTRIAVTQYHYERGFFWTLIDANSGEIVSELSILADPAVVWLPDSSGFAAEMRTEDIRQLGLFDHEGELQELIFSLPEGQIVGLYNLEWSTDGRHLAYNTRPESPWHYLYEALPEYNLYIADRQTRTIFETCLVTGLGLGWSNINRNQLAFLEYGQGQVPILLMDVESWESYIVAYHSNERPNSMILGWRAN